ncbi:DUF1851 domain-containing protein [Rhodovulum sulfidophilum]|uniref:GAD-like domain-containing protein n=1 Tax=Rhodovulum sulfidophilum TaxID=35806 RepID=UPI001924CF4A|nr:GAD-like domain-containing protein [Rhodovulum sulfidophilum]MBL3576294.1 DUF1851 domain-containing protein [Rhodovulum sulfidophilum]MCE8430734.1 DUF1851 domain-containing protein [Rhodovulum sulfidophilum]MCF4116740.1 DUF1851 domain-containing protein [Rhodovulum sulfidophilum]
MADIEKNYRARAEKLGEPAARDPMPEAELAYCEGRLPPGLIRFMDELGYATFQQGGVTIAKPSILAPVLALVFKSDPDLRHDDCTVVSYNPFGDLLVWSDRLKTFRISLAEGRISSQELAPTRFGPSLQRSKPAYPPDPNLIARSAVMVRPDDFDFLDYAGQEMLARCIAMHGPIDLGECYGFFPALALAGVESPMRRVENIRRVPALEHFAFLAQAQPFYLTKVGPAGIEKVREIG